MFAAMIMLLLCCTLRATCMCARVVAEKLKILAENRKKNEILAVFICFSPQNTCRDGFYHLYIAPSVDD